jgi:uncharacterized integral membrane protein
MIRKLIAVLILVPLAIVIVVLAVANRQGVTISLDPISQARTLAVTLPLFLVILISLTLGVIVGGVAAWLKQSKWRRHARHAQAELRALRGEVEALRQRLEVTERGAPSLPSIAYRRPPAA